MDFVADTDMADTDMADTDMDIIDGIDGIVGIIGAVPLVAGMIIHMNMMIISIMNMTLIITFIHLSDQYHVVF
jgi:hypothetical protein